MPCPPCWRAPACWSASTPTSAPTSACFVPADPAGRSACDPGRSRVCWGDGCRERSLPAAVRQVPLASFAHLALRRFPHRRRYLNGWTEPDRRMIERVRRDGFASADALYTVLINSDLDLVRDARARGLRTVHEVMIGPDIGRWVQEEQALFPGIEESVPPERDLCGQRARCPKSMSFRISSSCHRSSSVVRSSRSAVIRSGSRPCPMASMRGGLIRSMSRYRDACCSSAPSGCAKAATTLPQPSRILERRRVGLRGPRGRALPSRGDSPPGVQWPHLRGSGAAVPDRGRVSPGRRVRPADPVRRLRARRISRPWPAAFR